MTAGQEFRHYAAAYRGGAITILAHVLVLVAGFAMLAAVFDFPEILRRSAAERLTLFLSQAAIVRPAYWVLALTGFTQIGMAVFLYQAFRDRTATVHLFSLIFGVLTGVLQTLGFLRWAILVPYLAHAMVDPGVSDITRQSIALVEGSFNRYAGMAVGEHAANLSLGLWTLCLGLGMRRSPLFDRRLGTAGMVLAPFAFVLALEQLEVAPAVLQRAADLVFPAWVVWLVVSAGSLWRTDPRNGAGPRLTWRTGAWAVALWLLLTVPALLG